MHPDNPSKDAFRIQQMFRQIAGRYDLANRLISLGFDRSWRRLLLRAANLPPDGHLLDVGTGTGAIALEALRRDPGCRVTGVDFTFEMIRIGRGYPAGAAVKWCMADALNLPFRDAHFDAVTSAYLIRNVPDVSAALREQMRVVRPAGHVVCLETAPPGPGILRPVILFYLSRMIPMLGRLLSGNRAAYAYLPASTQAFLTPHQVTAIMRDVGLEKVRARLFMFGTQAIYRGTRPAES